VLDLEPRIQPGLRSLLINCYQSYQSVLNTSEIPILLPNNGYQSNNVSSGRHCEAPKEEAELPCLLSSLVYLSTSMRIPRSEIHRDEGM